VTNTPTSPDDLIGMKHNYPIRQSFTERFWAKVKRTTGCWVWQGAVAGIPPNHLYGYIQRGRRGEGLIRAPRASWELAHGDIPEGMVVCHHCDNPLCVRPDHLFLGTRSDNNRDAIAKGRRVYA
jgi:hypothetical protein